MKWEGLLFLVAIGTTILIAPLLVSLVIHIMCKLEIKDSEDDSDIPFADPVYPDATLAEYEE